MDGRRPLKFLEGPYPSAQEPLSPDLVKKSTKINRIHWGQEYWAGILQYASFLHMTVAGENPKERQYVENVVNKLKLKHRDKIHLYYNRTQARYGYDESDKKVREGEKCH